MDPVENRVTVNTPGGHERAIEDLSFTTVEPEKVKPVEFIKGSLTEI